MVIIKSSLVVEIRIQIPLVSQLFIKITGGYFSLPVLKSQGVVSIYIILELRVPLLCPGSIGLGVASKKIPSHGEAKGILTGIYGEISI